MSAITHTWDDGLFITSQVEAFKGEKKVRFIIEGPGEKNLCDVYMGREEAIAMAHALLNAALQLEAGNVNN